MVGALDTLRAMPTIPLSAIANPSSTADAAVMTIDLVPKLSASSTAVIFENVN